MQPEAEPKITSNITSNDVPQKKRANVPATMLALTTVVFAGLAVFFGINYFAPKTDRPAESGPSSATNPSNKPENVASMAEEYNEVRSMMESLASGITASPYVQNGSGLAVKPEGMNTYVQTRFNLYTEIRSDENIEENVALIKNKLLEEGFNAVGILPHGGSAGPKIDGYTNSDNITCGIYSDVKYLSENYHYDYLSFACAKTDWTWLTAKEKTTLEELETAYFQKTNEYPAIFGNTTSDVKDSTYEPYQTIWINVGGAAGLFYRTSPDSAWQYFTATQGELECTDYDTEDLKKAYFGEQCFSLEDGAQSTVQL